jgi:hypothetical protein
LRKVAELQVGLEVPPSGRAFDAGLDMAEPSTELPMTEQERLHKNALCDLLMKEGIDGRPDDDAIARTCSLTTLALDIGRADCLTRALAWHEILENRAITGTQAIVLDLSRANAIAGNRYGISPR